MESKIIHNDTLIEENLKIPNVLIVQKLDGVKVGETIKTNRNELDQRNSCIYGTQVSAHYLEGKDIKKVKESDNKIVIGYTKGLPFLIVVDGLYHRNTEGTFQFIDNHVISLMKTYSKKEAKSQDLIEAKEITKTLIRIIYGKYRNYSLPNSEFDFSMSIAMTYKNKNDNQLYCAGFGIGDTGLVLRKSTGEIRQLAYPTLVNGFKDAFEHFSIHHAGIERIIYRNTLFHVPVNPGDELFGYTYLIDLLRVAKEHEVILPQSDDIIKNSEKIVKSELDLNQLKLDTNKSLFTTVIKANEIAFENRCILAKREQLTCKFGDDCMMGSVIIPSESLQEQLFNYQKTYLMKDYSANSYLFFEKFDLFADTKKIEIDYFAKKSKKLYLKINNNPVANYYQLIELLNTVYSLESNGQECHTLFDQCIKIYDKLKNANNYPKNKKMEAIYTYTQGLIAQKPEYFYSLLDGEERMDLKLEGSSSMLLAKNHFKHAYELGYSYAACKLGMVCIDLKEYQQAKEYLDIAIEQGDEYAVIVDQHYLETDMYYQETIENNKNKCLVM